MVRIKIKDLPKDMKISKEEMKKITGGVAIFPASTKGGDVTLAFPDVCKTPAPPTSLIPTAMPNITTSGDNTKDDPVYKTEPATKPY